MSRAPGFCHSPETRRKMSESKKGKPHPLSESNRKASSEMCKQRTGERNPSWQGGLALIGDRDERARVRDNHTCQMCNEPGEVQVHHINRDRTDSGDENLVSVCTTCHRLVHQILKRGEQS